MNWRVKMSPYDNLWQTILMDLERLYNEDIYAELFQPISNTYKYQNGLITIVVASEYLKNRIKYLDFLKKKVYNNSCI